MTSSSSVGAADIRPVMPKDTGSCQTYPYQHAEDDPMLKSGCRCLLLLILAAAPRLAQSAEPTPLPGPALDPQEIHQQVTQPEALEREERLVHAKALLHLKSGVVIALCIGELRGAAGGFNSCLCQRLGLLPYLVF